jgi:streptomycin 6-kinase
MDIEDLTARMTRRYGPGVASWCARVPAMAAVLAERWALVLGEPFPSGNSSVAIRCSRAGGSGAVLKLSPDLPVVVEQLATLKLFRAGGRVPEVLAADADAGAVLLELIRPGTRADLLEPPPTARQWADLLHALHVAAVPPGYPRDLRAQCDGFFERIGRRVSDPQVGRRVSRADIERGAARCQVLVATQTEQVLLHGDLHLGNVIDGGPGRGLVAIDPRACIGDPCFDAVDYVLDGAGRDDPGPNFTGHDGIQARCAALASASGLDAERLFEWCRAVAAVVAIGYLRRPEREKAVADLLALAH